MFSGWSCEVLYAHFSVKVISQNCNICIEMDYGSPGQLTQGSLNDIGLRTRLHGSKPRRPLRISETVFKLYHMSVEENQMKIHETSDSYDCHYDRCLHMVVVELLP